MNKSQLLNSVIVVLQKESDWHLEHDDSNLSMPFRLGFLTGIAQAIFLVKNILEFVEDYE